MAPRLHLDLPLSQALMFPATDTDKRMKNHLRLAFMLLTLFLPTTLQLGKAHAGATAQPQWNAPAAAKYLDERGDEWLNWSGAARGQGTACLSCHTAMPFA